jgi:hypothetical protein
LETKFSKHISILVGGGLCVKIFRRVATFDSNRQSLAQRKTTKSAIELPKKSRTFVDQSLRERENPRLLHQVLFNIPVYLDSIQNLNKTRKSNLFYITDLSERLVHGKMVSLQKEIK